MLTLHYAPRTRAVRILWLLEELGVPYRLVQGEFAPPGATPEAHTFSQKTPLGKYPVLEDEGVVFCESGAILEYVLERYGEGRLAPPPGSPERGPFLQWIHFAEGTLFPPLGNLIRHLFYRQDADRHPEIVAEAYQRAHDTLGFLEAGLGDREYLMGEFSAADIMLGFSVGVARILGLLEDHPALQRYMERLDRRPALQKAMGGAGEPARGGAS
jgi:glutathione S-transferase